VLRVRFAICVLMLSVTRAKGQAIEAPGFDPRPLELGISGRAEPRPVTLMDLLTMREPEGLSISPDGKQIAFVLSQAVYESNSYRTGVFVVALTPGAVARNLGSAGMPHWDEINEWSPEAPQWSPDSKFFTCLIRRRDQEAWQVWKWSTRSGRARRITHVSGDVEGYEWFPNARQLFLVVRKRSAASRVPAQGILFDGNFRPWESVPVVEAIRRGLPVEREYWVHDLETGRERSASPAEIDHFLPFSDARDGTRKAAIDAGELIEGKTSPDGGRVAYLYAMHDPRRAKTASQGLYLETRAGGESVVFETNASYIDQYWWSPDGSRIYYSQLQGDGHSMRFMAATPENRQPSALFATTSPDYYSGFSIDAKGQRIACLRERSTTPPEIVVVEISTGEVRKVVTLNPEFAGLRLAPAVRMEGKNSYGDPWFAYLVKPEGYVAGKRYPLVVTTYRCGDYFLRGASGNESPIQVYAAQGFAVLCFDVGQPRNVAAGDFETKLLDWASPADSICLAVEELVRAGIADPERMGIFGFSHGEEIVGYLVTHSKLFRAAIGAAGYDPSFYYLAGNRWQALFARWGLGGWPDGDSRRKWQEIAMPLRANLVETAVLENASDSEYITYLPRVTALEELAKPVELHVYPYELHVRNQPRHKYEIYSRNLDWFRFWLKDERQFGADRAEELLRWEVMCKGQKASKKFHCP
jgi:dipeptidyl aminopeptidase/acylaminoacyl peptidase